MATVFSGLCSGAVTSLRPAQRLVSQQPRPANAPPRRLLQKVETLYTSIKTSLTNSGGMGLHELLRAYQMSVASDLEGTNTNSIKALLRHGDGVFEHMGRDPTSAHGVHAMCAVVHLL